MKKGTEDPHFMAWFLACLLLSSILPLAENAFVMSFPENGEEGKKALSTCPWPSILQKLMMYPAGMEYRNLSLLEFETDSWGDEHQIQFTFSHSFQRLSLHCSLTLSHDSVVTTRWFKTQGNTKWESQGRMQQGIKHCSFPSFPLPSLKTEESPSPELKWLSMYWRKVTDT